MRANTALLSLYALSAALLGVAGNEHGIGKRGPGRRHRGVNYLDQGSYTLSKRYDDARYSVYDVTTGEVACGGFYHADDYVRIHITYPY